MKATMCEMKNTLVGNNGNLDVAEEKISEFEDRTIETIQYETEQKENFKMNRASMSCGKLQI